MDSVFYVGFGVLLVVLYFMVGSALLIPIFDEWVKIKGIKHRITARILGGLMYWKVRRVVLAERARKKLEATKKRIWPRGQPPVRMARS